MSYNVNNGHVPLGGFTVPRPVFKRLEELTAPTGTVLEVVSLKSHLRISHSADDAYLAELIAVATDVVERYLNRRLLARSVRMWMDFLPGTGQDYNLWGAGASDVPIRYATVSAFRWFDLFGTPVTAFTSLTYVTDAGTTQTFDPANYIADFTDKNMPARIILQRSSVWPTDLQVAHSLAATYTLGYADAASIPASIKHGVRLVAAALYSNRGDNADAMADVLHLPNIAATLTPYRVLSVSTL